MPKPKFGIMLPHSGPLATPSFIRTVAVRSQELGLDSLWVHDHISYGSDWLGHSTSRTSNKSGRMEPKFYESLTTLAFASGFTRDVLLGTALIVLPLRSPLILGRQLMTLQDLSGGRLILGVGIGDYPGDFSALAVPYSKRAAIFEEYLEVLLKVFRGGRVSHEGKFLSIEEAYLYPKVRPPPIYLGGGFIATPEPENDLLVDRVLNRVARFGDGWMPDWGTPEMVARGLERIQYLARRRWKRGSVKFDVIRPTNLFLAETDDDAQLGSAPAIYESEKVASKVARYGTRTPQKSFDYSLVGSRRTILNKIDAYVASGVTRFVLGCLTDRVDRQIKMMERFGSQIASSY